MSNHVHLLATPETDDGISRMMQTLGRRYVRYFNHTYQRTGTLWKGRFKFCLVDADEYLLVCQRYIELNPVRAGMVTTPAAYTWSSFAANGLGKAVNMWSPHHLYLGLGKSPEERARAYRDLFVGHLDAASLQEIRTVSNNGMVLGSERFKKEIEALSGRRVTPMKRGPKPSGRKDEFLH